jgi:hypothetical protein
MYAEQIIRVTNYKRHYFGSQGSIFVDSFNFNAINRQLSPFLTMSLNFATNDPNAYGAMRAVITNKDGRDAKIQIEPELNGGIHTRVTVFDVVNGKLDDIRRDVEEELGNKFRCLNEPETPEGETRIG